MLRGAVSGGAAPPAARRRGGRGGKATMSPEEHKALVRRWFAETDKGNLAIIDELLPPEYLDHNPPIPGLPRGREGIRQANLLLRAAFPDVVHIIDDQVAEGDKVMTRVTTRATFLGAFLGLPADGEGDRGAGHLGPPRRGRPARWSTGRRPTWPASWSSSARPPPRRGRATPRRPVRRTGGAS